MLQEMMARSLSLSPRYIARLANNASHRYYHFTIPKHSGGTRDIYHPAKPLKAIQRWLQGVIVSRLPLHDAAAAYREGLNIADHARRHMNCRYLLRVDLAAFFESITAEDVEAYINYQLAHFPTGWTVEDTSLFIDFVCMNGHLTIGAPTSPGLSNALCYPLDHSLSTQCTELNVTYSRYADDLFFSTHIPDVLQTVPALAAAALRSIRYPRHLAINPTKTRHSSLKRRRRVTGIVLSNQGGVSIGRRFKRRIRSEVYRFDILGPEAKVRLAGLLAYVQDIEPAFFNRLVVKYGEKVSRAARPPKQTNA